MRCHGTKAPDRRKSTLMNRPQAAWTARHWVAVTSTGSILAALSPDELSAVRNKKIGFDVPILQPDLQDIGVKKWPELPMTCARIPKREKGTERAMELLECVGLEKRAEAPLPDRDRPDGQTPRCQLPRALANSRPPLILADEPTGNLDAAASIEIRGDLQNSTKREPQ
ncbi:hypothetical protein [Hungatella sp.]|uniref:hypothetical protein n=1 Tax=Hungatella sp. TaxID=2613924 RepID=UPI003991D607